MHAIDTFECAFHLPLNSSLHLLRVMAIQFLQLKGVKGQWFACQGE